jgi:tetratricopeptide (TPR) repeat protein
MSAADKLVEEGELKLAEMDFKAAFAKFKKAVETDANNARAYFGRAESALGLEKVSPGDILRDYRKAAELDPKQAGFYLSSLGAFNLSLGQLPQAEAAYKEAASKDPENAVQYLTDFAVSYYQAKMGESEEMDKAEMDAIRYQTLVYLCNALALSPADAIELLTKMPQPPPPRPAVAEVGDEEDA